jgi:hypothetical protein
MPRIAAIALAVCLAGLSHAAAHAAAAGDGAGPLTATLLWYEEKEPGTDVYPVRIIVSTGFVRIDDDDDNGGFVLLDRASRDLYSVDPEEQTILVFGYRDHEQQPPADLRLDEEIEADDAAPAIAGRRPLLISLKANDTICYRVAAVPGLLDDAVAGLAEYARVLGNRQLGDLQSVPAEMQTPCFLSRYAYAPDRHLRHGLPIQVWDQAGYQRALVNFRSGEQVDPGLLKLPAHYRRMQMEGGGL